MEAVKCQLYAAELQAFLRVTVATSEEAIREYRAKEVAPLVLITTWFLCIRIAIKIVEDRDALSALQSEEVQLCVPKVASYLQAYPNEHATTISIVLAGLELPQRKRPVRKSCSSGLLTFRFAMDRKETQGKGAFARSE